MSDYVTAQDKLEEHYTEREASHRIPELVLQAVWEDRRKLRALEAQVSRLEAENVALSAVVERDRLRIIELLSHHDRAVVVKCKGCGGTGSYYAGFGSTLRCEPCLGTGKREP